MTHGKIPGKFFTKEEEDKIVQAIGEAEKNTSGEIRVHLHRSFQGDTIEEGKKIFEKLGMTQTRDRNGILFLLELKHQQLILLGDTGIHQKVSEHFWEEIRDIVLLEFKQSKFAEGLVQGILRCGEKLKEFFPRQEGDIDELSNQITEGAD